MVEITIIKDVGIWIAFVHGILAFFSPCVIPLIPGFLGILFTSENKFFKVFGYFMGISSLFTIMGSVSGSFGKYMMNYGTVINIVLGSLIILMGILYFFNVQILKVKGLNIWKYKGGGFWNGFLFGAAIGFVWIPCSSPVLGSIFLIASQTNPLRGAILLFIFSLGISVPFLTLGGFMTKLINVGFGKPKWERYLKVLGSIFMVTLGTMMVLGKMSW